MAIQVNEFYELVKKYLPPENELHKELINLKPSTDKEGIDFRSITKIRNTVFNAMHGTIDDGERMKIGHLLRSLF